MRFLLAFTSFSVIFATIGAQLIPKINGKGMRFEFQRLLGQSGPDPIALNVFTLRNIQGAFPIVGGTFNVDEIEATLGGKIHNPNNRSTQKRANVPNRNRVLRKRAPRCDCRKCNSQ